MIRTRVRPGGRSLRCLVKERRQLAHSPLQAVHGGAGLFVGLPGGVPLAPRLGAVLARCVQGVLGGGEPVLRRVERFFTTLHGGQSISKRILRRSQPAAQVGQLPHRLTASACPVHYPTIIASTPPTRHAGHGSAQLAPASAARSCLDGRVRVRRGGRPIGASATPSMVVVAVYAGVVDDAVTELAAYFQTRTRVLDAELIRLTRAARAAGASWAAIAAACGVTSSQDMHGVVSGFDGSVPRTAAGLLFGATQYAVEKLTGSRRYPPLTWPCPACGHQVTDRAATGRPVHIQHGHVDGCARLARDQAANDAHRQARLPRLIASSEPPSAGCSGTGWPKRSSMTAPDAAGTGTSTTTWPPFAATGVRRYATTATPTCTPPSPSPSGSSPPARAGAVSRSR
jgi:hypothetical protein